MKEKIIIMNSGLRTLSETKLKPDSLKFSNHKKEYFLAYLSIALLNPTFAYYNIFHIIFTLYAFYEFNRVRLKLDKLFFVIIFSLAVLIFGQAITLANFEIESVIGLYLTFLLPYFIIKRIGTAFWRYFVNIIYFLAIIALVFWFLQNLSNSFSILLKNISSSLRLDPRVNESIIIYNLERHRTIDLFGIMKNAGFTAEGGVYSGVLIIAIYFNTLVSKQIFDKKNIVFFISILTTTSTAGYAALFILLVGFSISFNRNFHRLILFPVLLFIIYQLAFDLPFLYQKVDKYFQDELNVYSSNVYAPRLGRFNSAFQEISSIKKYPLFGRGIFKDDRVLSVAEKELGISGSLMGVVNLLSKFGIPFYIFYMILLYKSFISYSKNNGFKMLLGITGFTALIAINIGQVMLTSGIVLILVYCKMLNYNGTKFYNRIT